MHQVLHVDVDTEMRSFLTQTLGSIVEIRQTAELKKAKQLLRQDIFSMVFAGIQLPDGDGISLISPVQAIRPLIPVIFLTRIDDLAQKVLCYSCGADDYIVYPCNPVELKAKVESKLSRLSACMEHGDVLRWKDLQIDKRHHEVSVFSDGRYRKVNLTALEFRLLCYFASYPGEVLERDRILNEIWGEDIHIYSRSVDTHVSKLRKKLQPVSHVIQSVHGAGYKFQPEEETHEIIKDRHFSGYPSAVHYHQDFVRP